MELNHYTFDLKGETKLKVGDILITDGVFAKMAIEKHLIKEVNKSIERFSNGDWGDYHPSFHKRFDKNLQERTSVLGFYAIGDDHIFIHNEFDGITVVLLPSEWNEIFEMIEIPDKE